jgi:hypothetical protein
MPRVTKALAISGMAISLVFAGATAVPAQTAPAADGSAPQAAAGIVNKSDDAKSTETYWTKERMARATPEPGPILTDQDKETTPLPDRLPPVRPEKTPGFKDVDPLVGSKATLWSPHGQMPATTTGKIYFRRTDGTNGYCTDPKAPAVPARSVRAGIGASAAGGVPPAFFGPIGLDVVRILRGVDAGGGVLGRPVRGVRAEGGDERGRQPRRCHSSGRNDDECSSLHARCPSLRARPRPVALGPSTHHPPSDAQDGTALDGHITANQLG